MIDRPCRLARTTAHLAKVYDGTQWVTIATLNPSDHSYVQAIGAGGTGGKTAAEARASLGIGGWLGRQSLTLTATATAIDVPLSASKILRVTGKMIPSTPGQNVKAQASLDGGASYDVAENYRYGVNGSGYNSDTSWPICASVASSLYDALFEMIFIPGGSGKLARGRSDYNGMGSLQFFSGVYDLIYANPGEITHLRFYPSAGTWAAGTTVVVQEIPA